MTKDQFVFEKLARGGECWHESLPTVRRCRGIDRDTGEVGFCKITHDPADANPDFATWEGFGWMWERIVEDSCLFSKFWTYVTDKAPWTEDVWTAIHLNNPIRLRDELAKYLDWEGSDADQV